MRMTMERKGKEYRKLRTGDGLKLGRIHIIRTSSVSERSGADWYWPPLATSRQLIAGFT